MKKIIFSLPLIFIFLLPIPQINSGGAYNTISKSIWCNNKSDCIHEVAHKLDQEADWVSRTTEFSMAVKVFLMWQYKIEEPSPLVYEIIFTSGAFEFNGYFSDPQAEVYANIFEWSGGKQENMPEIFRQFYDWQRAGELIKKYVR